MTAYRNPDEFDYQRFDLVEVNGDIISAIGLKVKAGAQGLVVAEYNGFSVWFDTSVTINNGKLVQTNTCGMFMVDHIEGYMLKTIRKTTMKED